MSAASRAAAAERAAGRFRAWHGAEPEGVWHAPGRANLIGEHTDYNEGRVLPFALDRGVVVAARGRGDDVLDIRSLQADAPVTVPLATLRAGSVTGWAAYPAGVAWALREAGQAVGGASLVIDSDLPQGAGLSSSAAIECATAVALVALYQVSVSRLELARLARRGENEMVGVPAASWTSQRPCSARRATPCCWTAAPGTPRRCGSTPAPLGWRCSWWTPVPGMR